MTTYDYLTPYDMRLLKAVLPMAREALVLRERVTELEKQLKECIDNVPEPG